MIKFGKDEILWLTQKIEDNTYYVTSDILRQNYKLYILENNKAVFTKRKACNPRELEKWMK